MDKYIKLSDAVWVLCKETCHPGIFCPDSMCVEMWDKFKDVPTADVVEVVRCKDCKHFPIGTNRDDLVFPDEVCPCHCEDFWYSWKPKDDFYCGKGERKDD